MSEVKRTERGWAGHFICAQRCRFRRNTLLECGDVRIVVSTVGMMEGYPREKGFEMIGFDRHFETMAFHARWEQDRYWDADISRGEISFNSPWSIAELDADDRANNMHEVVVDEIAGRLKQGDLFVTDRELETNNKSQHVAE